MNEKDPAEFDPETADLARRLSELDFSEESRVRESLRTRLADRAGEMRQAAWKRRWAPVFAPAAAFAAIALVFFVGLPRGPVPAPEPPSAGDRVLVRPPMVGDKPVIPEAVLSEDFGYADVALGAGPQPFDTLKGTDLFETVH